MNHGNENDPGNQSVWFVPATGSPVGGHGKDKRNRITDAVADLQIVIGGAATVLEGASEAKLWTQVVGALARASSIFLRKLVLGNRGQRESRLLDDRLIEAAGLQFHRLRKIPKIGRRTIEVGLSLGSAGFVATRLDERTGEALETHEFAAAPQAVKVSIEWPLPGVADWTRVPSEESRWSVNPDQLFEQNTKACLSCDEWLSQQVVVFDQRSISLKRIIQTVANYDGAHSISTARLSTPEGHRPSRAARDPAPHILNAVSFFGHGYLDLIVIECAMYLFQRLIDVEQVTRPLGDIYTFSFELDCSPDQAESGRPDWAAFRGTMMVSFSGVPSVVSHTVRAVG